SSLARELLHVSSKHPIFWLGPGLDGAFVQRLRFVGDDEVEIEINGVAKSLAARTCAIGIVEREQTRFRFLITQVAGFAFEALRKAQTRRLLFTRGGLENDLSRFTIGALDGVHDARASVGGDGNTIYQHEDWLREVDVQQRLWS